MESSESDEVHGHPSPHTDSEEAFAMLEHTGRAENQRMEIKDRSSDSSRGTMQHNVDREGALQLGGEAEQSTGKEPINLENSTPSPINVDSPLVWLPNEVLEHVLRFLSPQDVDRVGLQCRKLYKVATQDLIWKEFVQDNVPGCTLLDPSPFSTWRELYRSHDPHWFLSKQKIWFGDHRFTGKLVLIRYNPKTACMEGFHLVSDRGPQMPQWHLWGYNNAVAFQDFAPRVKLHLDRPALILSPNNAPFIKTTRTLGNDETQGEKQKLRSVINSSILALNTASESQRLFGTFELCRNIPYYRQMAVWPPVTIPSSNRVRNDSNSRFESAGHRPSKLHEVSQSGFRTRTWLYNRSMRGQESPNPFFIHNFSAGEEVHTFGTLDAKLYTPTLSKPYRGIWVGDYSGHGCEFILLHQPDDETPFDDNSVVQREDETSEDFETRRKDERIYRGSIHAIKLTGDPNMARGEYTFSVKDIGAAGFVRYADDEAFMGARIVKSIGFIAEQGGHNARNLESQLIMISHNKLAHYWIGDLGHINLYERVNIDQFLDPANDSQAS